MESQKSATVPAGRRDRNEQIVGLVQAARNGDSDAVGELVTEFSPLLWQVARAAGLRSGDAEDVVQTVWLRLLMHLDEIRTPAALTGWLITTTRREAWRVRGAGRRHVAVDQDWLDTVPDPQPGSEEMVIIGDRRRELWAALGQLSPRCQELLRIMAFVPRPSYDAIAAELDMPQGSIGPTRGRCLAKLRTLLGGATEGIPQ